MESRQFYQASLLSFTSFPAEAIIRNQAYFGRFLASLFVQKTFDKSIRSKVQDLVDLSIKEMKLLLAEVKWMDNATKQKAIKKADEMISTIGYDDELLDPTKMNAYYDPILEKMDSNSIVNNQVLLLFTLLSLSLQTIY